MAKYSFELKWAIDHGSLRRSDLSNRRLYLSPNFSFWSRLGLSNEELRS